MLIIPLKDYIEASSNDQNYLIRMIYTQMYQTATTAPENLNLLLETKDEYTRQFINITRAPFIQGILSIYDSVKSKNKQHKFLLKEFQHALKNIPQWSQFILQQEESRFKQVTGCDWMEELMKATFVANIHILGQLTNKSGYEDKSLHVEIPSLKTFLHNAYISIARCLWKKPFLMYHRVSKVEYQKNMTELETIVEENIKETFRQSLPYKELISSFLEGSMNRKDISHVARQAEDMMKQFDDQLSPPASPKALSRVQSLTNVLPPINEEEPLGSISVVDEQLEHEPAHTQETVEEIKVDANEAFENVKMFSLSDESDTEELSDMDDDDDDDMDDYEPVKDSSETATRVAAPESLDASLEDENGIKMVDIGSVREDHDVPVASLISLEDAMEARCGIVDNATTVEAETVKGQDDIYTTPLETPLPEPPLETTPDSVYDVDAINETNEIDEEGIKKIDIKGGHRTKKRTTPKDTNAKIKKYLGIDISWNELAENRKQIRKMLLQKSVQRH
jgi:hypothetical protein